MRFGVLCNGNQFQQWQLEAVRLLISDGHTCELLIKNANQFKQPTLREKIRNYPYFKLLYRIWYRYGMKPESKKMVDISAEYAGLREILCATTRRKGISEYFSEKDIELIKEYNLDFILRFGFGILKGEILNSAKYGVWSYHHDDDRKYRGVPTGFWEIMFNDPVNAAILQRLTEKIDSGTILYKAYFGTINHSWQANLNNLLSASTEWPLQVCRKIETGDTGFLAEVNSSDTALYKLPGNLKMLRFLTKVSVNKMIFHFRDLFLTEKWNVGLLNTSVENLVKQGSYIIPEPKWLNIQNRKQVYHADSFGLQIDGHYHVLCEEYDYKIAKGVLVSLLIDADSGNILKKTKALETEYHLAYPYFFKFENQAWCVPESSESGDLSLYRYNPQNGKLVFEQILIHKLQAVDPSLFFYDGIWWLFFTDRTSTNERLHIWYSETLKGTYVPHANNPVKTNISSSRPAGNPFILNGSLFRPAQDCSVRSGRRITINRIITLSTTQFDEEEYSILSPAKGSEYGDGMHTFCATGDLIIVDGKREQFIWQAFAGKLSIKLNRLLKIIR